MGQTLIQLCNTQLAATAGTLYTCPTQVRTRILAATATNDTTTGTTFTLHIVNSGGSADATNIKVNAQALTSSQAYTVSEIIGHVLTPGQTLQGLAADASQVSLLVSGVEVT